MATCDWSTSLEDLERGSEVEYYMTVKDISTAATGTNTNTTSTNSFEVGDPNKVFVVEWHDMGWSYTYTCTYQVLMYDVTNEIEFKYDTGCQALTITQQLDTKTKPVQGCNSTYRPRTSTVLTHTLLTTESVLTAAVTHGNPST